MHADLGALATTLGSLVQLEKLDLGGECCSLAVLTKHHPLTPVLHKAENYLYDDNSSDTHWDNANFGTSLAKLTRLRFLSLKSTAQLHHHHSHPQWLTTPAFAHTHTHTHASECKLRTGNALNSVWESLPQSIETLDLEGRQAASSPHPLAPLLNLAPTLLQTHQGRHQT